MLNTHILTRKKRVGTDSYQMGERSVLNILTIDGICAACVRVVILGVSDLALI